MSTIRVANIDRQTDILRVNKAHKNELKSIDIKLYQLNELINHTSDWFIIGEREENLTDKGSAVFLRRSKSEKALIFFIGDICYVINVENINDESRQYIGVAKFLKNVQTTLEDK